MKCKIVYTLDLPSEALTMLNKISSQLGLSRSTVVADLICCCYDRLLSEPDYSSSFDNLSDSQFIAMVNRVLEGGAR